MIFVLRLMYITAVQRIAVCNNGRVIAVFLSKLAERLSHNRCMWLSVNDVT